MNKIKLKVFLSSFISAYFSSPLGLIAFLHPFPVAMDMKLSGKKGDGGHFLNVCDTFCFLFEMYLGCSIITIKEGYD